MGLLKVKAEEVEVFAIARDIAEFPALTQDLDAELAERWAPLQLSGGDAALRAGIGPDLEIAIVAVGEEDEDDLGPVTKVIQTARDIGLKVLLVVKDVSPKSLHTLMRTGADDFAPYPFPEGGLADSIANMRGSSATQQTTQSSSGPKNRRGLIIPVYSVAGGVGASTFAVNLAWELSLLTKKTDKRVCILDFNFQFGSVSTYLDLPRREAIYELISDPSRSTTTRCARR